MTKAERNALETVLGKVKRARGCAKRKDLGGALSHLIDAVPRLERVLGLDPEPSEQEQDDDHQPPRVR